MKVYYHLSIEGFTNCYLVVNDDPSVMEALIVDPCTINEKLINQIEEGGYKLTAVLVTHNHGNHIRSLSTLSKIYSPSIYAADYEITGSKACVIFGDGHLKAAGFDVEYFSVPGHTADSMVYKIGEILFTGDVIACGIIGETSGKYFKQMLGDNIEKKIFSQTDEIVLMPGHGPPSTVASEKLYNLDITKRHFS